MIELTCAVFIGRKFKHMQEIAENLSKFDGTTQKLMDGIISSSPAVF